MKTVIGIDLGTQSVKAVFYDFQNREVVASGSAPLNIRRDDDGTAEQHADWWINALQEALATIDRSVRASAMAVGVSGQQHGFVPLNSSGKAIAPVKLWCDTSTGQECSEIMDRFGGPKACLEELGNPILPGYTASKILWLKRNHPALYEDLDCILLPHDFLNFYLTGERCMEAGDASGTGFLDIRSRTWSEKLLRAIDPDRDLSPCLPGVRLDNGHVGHVRAETARILGLPEGLPVSIGGGDNMMGAIGTANLRAGKLTMSLGTSGTVYAYSDAPIIDPKGNIAAFCSSTGGWLPLLCTMNCTVTTELMRNLLGADIANFESLISAAGRGADGIVTLPFFNGERTPDLPNAKGCLLGLNGNNMSPGNLLRSAVEGATYALKFGIDELASLGVHAEEIVVTGGGAKSATWRQVVADVCATPVVVFEQDEGAAFGAAMQALQIVESGSRLEDLVEEHLTRDATRCCEPQSAAVADYKDFYQDYQQAVGTIARLYT